MHCTQISLTHFRNYNASSFQFTEKLIGICGSNGAGKTNLLDGLYYSCFTKSYFVKSDIQNVKHGHAGMRIEALFEKEKSVYKVVTILRENNRKEISVNDETYSRFSQHIGKFPCVMIAPDDVSLINESSDERRKYIDTILSQTTKNYLQSLIEYNKILQQRNSFLKFASERNYVDEELLSVLNKQLTEKGNFIFKERKKFLEKFLPRVSMQYEKIAAANDNISLVYESQLNENSFENLMAENRSRDLFLQRTGCGIHKDELGIYMNEALFKNTASQGQKKTLLFALKLAEFEVIKENTGITPLLLLDDVFEKLDAVRMQQLLNEVCMKNDAQVFITDTHKQRLEDALLKTGKQYQLIELA